MKASTLTYPVTSLTLLSTSNWETFIGGMLSKKSLGKSG